MRPFKPSKATVVSVDGQIPLDLYENVSLVVKLNNRIRFSFELPGVGWQRKKPYNELVDYYKTSSEQVAKTYIEIFDIWGAAEQRRQDAMVYNPRNIASNLRGCNYLSAQKRSIMQSPSTCDGPPLVWPVSQSRRFSIDPAADGRVCHGYKNGVIVYLPSYKEPYPDILLEDINRMFVFWYLRGCGSKLDRYPSEDFVFKL